MRLKLVAVVPGKLRTSWLKFMVPVRMKVMEIIVIVLVKELGKSVLLGINLVAVVPGKLRTLWLKFMVPVRDTHDDQFEKNKVT